MTLTSQFLRSVAADESAALDCPDCGRTGLDVCDTTRHLATSDSFARYVSRADRIWAFKRAAQETQP